MRLIQGTGKFVRYEWDSGRQFSECCDGDAGDFRGCGYLWI
jgi:hypothetical protein